MGGVKERSVFANNEKRKNYKITRIKVISVQYLRQDTKYFILCTVQNQSCIKVGN